MQTSVKELRCLINEVVLKQELAAWVDDHRDELPLLGKELGRGGDGIVYSTSGGGAVKVGAAPKAWWEQLLGVLQGFASEPNGLVAYVADYGEVGSMGDKVVYYYMMEKLQPLTVEEGEAVFDRIMVITRPKSLQGRYEPKATNPRAVKKVDDFFHRVDAAGLKHLDLQPNNVMKDRRGNLKFVDLESFVEADW